MSPKKASVLEPASHRDLALSGMTYGICDSAANPQPAEPSEAAQAAVYSNTNGSPSANSPLTMITLTKPT